jgi:hypothetical protein
VQDNISYVFSSAFTMSPDGMKAHIIPEDADDELIEERWYTPPHMREPKPTIKRIRFSSDTKTPKRTEHTVSAGLKLVRT